MNQMAEERLMTIADRSKMLGVPIDTLYGWRHRGEGPEGPPRRPPRSLPPLPAWRPWLKEQADRR